MRRRKIPTTGTLPAGIYYVGDPCYTIHDDAAWDEFLKLLYAAETLHGDGLSPVIFEYRGRPCFVSSTNTGDGCYSDQYGEMYPVNAGMLAAIPIEVLDEYSGLKVRAFDQPFQVGGDKGRWIKSKLIKIGDIRIRT